MYKRGDIFFVKLKTDTGSVQSGCRPVVVISNDIGNRFSNTCICAIVTTQNKNKLPTHVEIEIRDFKKDKINKSVIKLEQLMTIDKSLFGQKIKALNEYELKKVDEAILISMGIK